MVLLSSNAQDCFIWAKQSFRSINQLSVDYPLYFISLINHDILPKSVLLFGSCISDKEQFVKLIAKRIKYNLLIVNVKNIFEEKYGNPVDVLYFASQYAARYYSWITYYEQIDILFDDSNNKEDKTQSKLAELIKEDIINAKKFREINSLIVVSWKDSDSLPSEFKRIFELSMLIEEDSTKEIEEIMKSKFELWSVNISDEEYSDVLHFMKRFSLEVINDICDEVVHSKEDLSSIKNDRANMYNEETQITAIDIENAMKKVRDKYNNME